jgi:hypothetical protein
MQLIDTKQTYEFQVDMGLGKEKNPIFQMKKLTSYEVDELDDNSTLTSSDSSKSGEVKFLQGTLRKMKLDFAVVGFVKNIMSGDKLAKFNKENMAMLPPNVRNKLVEHIDEKNELNPEKNEEDSKVKK